VAKQTTLENISTRWWQWWPLLLGPLGMAYACLAVALDAQLFFEKDWQEILALILTGAAAVVAVRRAVRSRHPYAIVLSAVAIVVVLREIHWDWMSPGVYIGLALICAWSLLWRKRLVPYSLANPQVRVWLVATAATYVLSQFLARRGLQHVVGEETALGLYFQTTYGAMEEVVENVAHIMLLVTVCIGWYPRGDACNQERVNPQPPAG